MAKEIGESTKFTFSVKTLGWIFGVLYLILGYLYWDLRAELRQSVEISKEEKTEFLNDVEEKWDDKLDKVLDVTHIIQLDQTRMQGDIKVILDRNQRMAPIEQPSSAAIQPAELPPSTMPTDTIGN